MLGNLYSENNTGTTVTPTPTKTKTPTKTPTGSGGSQLPKSGGFRFNSNPY